MSKTLICTEAFLPYVKGDVFTVTDEEYKLIQDQKQDDKDRDYETRPLIKDCVEDYDASNKKHVKMLDEQRGKTEDVEPETVVEGGVKVDVDAIVAKATESATAAAEKIVADAKAEADKILADAKKAAEAGK
jgi:hypothetical protein